MPLYEYTCEKCNHKSEKLRPTENRNDPIECSKCGSKAVRVIALTGEPKFLGSGWTPKYN